MVDEAMQRKLKVGQAIDVSKCPRTVTGDYFLKEFVEDQEYYDMATGERIRSIGAVTRPLPSRMADGSARVLMPGDFLAATSTKYYTPNIEDPTKCVYLR